MLRAQCRHPQEPFGIEVAMYRLQALLHHIGVLDKIAERLILRWPRLFGQISRFDKWNVCRG